MTVKNEEAQCHGWPLLERCPQGDEVAQGLVHLFPTDHEHSIMEPVSAEGFPHGGLALGDLAFVMGELVFHSASVDVERLPQVFSGHGRALGVPAREPPSPRAGPAHDVRRGRFLPEGKIGWMPLLLIRGGARGLLQFLNPAPG